MKRGLAIGCGLAMIVPFLLMVISLVVSGIDAYREMRATVPEGATVAYTNFSFGFSPGTPFVLLLIFLLFISGMILLVRYGKRAPSEK